MSLSGHGLGWLFVFKRIMPVLVMFVSGGPTVGAFRWLLTAFVSVLYDK